MRCLFCDKKLSLLKLAKGDSFCSPEHFDAYQLQMSKNDIDRLMGLPLGDTPKAPLIVTPRHETPAGKDDRKDEDQARPPQLPAPPYAAFARPPLPSFPPASSAPLTDELAANSPDGGPHQPALPVHEIKFATGVLNLHLQLNYSAISPRNWAREYDADLIPEDFRREPTRPSLELTPDLPGDENRPQSEPAPRVESITAAGPRLPFLAAPSFGERAGMATPFDCTASSGPHCPILAPLLHPGTPAQFDLPGTIDSCAGFAGMAAIPFRNYSFAIIRVVSELPADADFVLPGTITNTFNKGWLASSGLIELTSKALEIGVARTSAVSFDLPQAASLLVRPDAPLTPVFAPRRILAGQPAVSLTGAPLDVGASARREVPSPLEAVRLSPLAPAAGRPAKRSMQAGVPFRGVLEALPVGREAVFVNPPPSAVKFDWQSVLAQVPAKAPFSTATWQNLGTHRALSVLIADGVEASMFPQESLPFSQACVRTGPAGASTPSLAGASYRRIEWKEAVFALPGSPSPKPQVATFAPVCSAPSGGAGKTGLIASAVREIELQALAVTSGGLVAETELPPASPAIMPEINDVPGGKIEISFGSPLVRWEPRLPALKEQPVVKFLPVRKGPILPSARSWPRLGSLPR